MVDGIGDNYFTAPELAPHVQLYRNQVEAARPKHEVLSFWAKVLDIESKLPIQYASRVLKWAEYGVEASVLQKNIPQQWPIPRNYFATEAP